MIQRKRGGSNLAFTLVGDSGPSAERTGPVRWSVSEPQAERLAELARGKRVLEIGTGTGLSTEALARHAVSVRTYDVDDEVKRLVWPHLPANVTAVDRRVHPVEGVYDLLFIDGLHDGEGVAADLRDCIPTAAPGAIWVFHDWQMAGVEKTVTESKLFRVTEVQSDAGPTQMAIAELLP
jgi:predicted O-methyltransferase YrrM